MYIPDSISSFQRIMGQWMDKAGQGGDCQSTLYEREIGISEAALRNCFTGNFEIPKILGYEEARDLELLEEFSRPGGCIGCCKIFRINSSQFRHFESAEVEQ